MVTPITKRMRRALRPRESARRIARRAFVDDVNLITEGTNERRLTQPDGLGQPLAATKD